MSEENIEIVRRWWQGFNEDGMPPLALCADDIEIRNPPDFPLSGLYKGHDGVRLWRDQVWDIFDDLRVEPEEIIDARDGEAVLMLLRAIGTAPHFEVELELEWAAIWTIRDGKVVDAQGYMRRADAREAAGLSP